MNQQITNYIRGKVLEMIVVGVATWIGFILFGLNYSLLLAVLVGFSVLIPYIGALWSPFLWSAWRCSSSARVLSSGACLPYT